MNMNRLNTIIGTMQLSNIIITKIVNTEKYYNTYLNINKNNIKIITDLENYCYAEPIDKIDNSNYINQFNINMLYEKTYCEKTILSNLDNIFNKTKVHKYIIPDTYHVYNTEFTKYYINYDQLNYNKGTSIINNLSVPKELLLSQKQLIKLLINEIKKINSNRDYKHYIFPEDDNIFKLRIRLFINSNSIIGKQLEEINKKYDYNYIELQLNIDSEGYPYIAPKIEYIKPHANLSFILSINNMDILKQHKWSSLISLEYFILNLVEIIEKLDKEYIVYELNPNYHIDTCFNKLISFSKHQIYDKIDFNFTSTFQLYNQDIKKSHWANGTGYGSNDIKSDWDINKFIKDQDTQTQYHTQCLVDIGNILETEIKEIDQVYIDIIYKHFLNNITNINLLEFQSNINLYIKLFYALLRAYKRLDKDQINCIAKECKHLSDEIEYIINTNKNDNDDMPAYVHIHHILKSFFSYKEPIEELNILANVKEAYCHIMKSLQFGHFDLDSKHSYYNKKDDKIEQKPIMRMLSEISSLKKNLPLNWDTSIWLRVSKMNFNILTVLIAGPKNTPYENGLFEFHIYLPTDYPNRAPLVLINTTNGGLIRFNPNLYANGKVCLSLLGTWSGSGGEVWNKQTSSLLQVLVSIQSLILVDDPYFNEPGYEKHMKEDKYIKASQSYNEEKQPHTIELAMINMIKNPIPGFEQVIKEHFTKKKEEILNRTQIWIQNAEKHKDIMTQRYDELKELLDKL